MPSISIRNVDQHTLDELKRIAASNGRSLQAELRALLDQFAALPWESLLADYQLADGTTGMQVVEHARRMQPGIACFMVSGDMKADSAGRQDMSGAAPAERLQWLAKPVHPATLHQALQKVRRS